jgi:hypothetical protein
LFTHAGWPSGRMRSEVSYRPATLHARRTRWHPTAPPLACCWSSASQTPRAPYPGSDFRRPRLRVAWSPPGLASPCRPRGRLRLPPRSPTHAHPNRSVLGMARPSGRVSMASPSPPSRQVPLAGKSAFWAHPSNRPSSCPPQRSALPAVTAAAEGMASADPCRLSPVSQPRLPSNVQRPGNRSPQIRALTIPAYLPDLPLCPLMAWTSWLHAHSSGLTASYRVRVPQVAVLPPASSGPRLAATPLPLAMVGAINLREGLPPS